MTKLKPCPFCGSIPIIHTLEKFVNQPEDEDCVIVGKRVIFRCDKCFLIKDIGITKSVDRETFNSMSKKEFHKMKKQMVTKCIEDMWNRRVQW